MTDLNAMKKETFCEALMFSLDVVDETDKKIASLVPIGNWALRDSELLKKFTAWRQLFMRFFLTQFQASEKKTQSYLKNFSIEQNNRILFAIFMEKALVGHIGLSNVSRSTAELDNIIRGQSGGHKDLIYFSEKALLEWAFDNINVSTIYAQVMSKNFMALSLHERFLFKSKNRRSLRKIVSQASIAFEVCNERSSTENFFLEVMEVSREDFFKSVTRSKKDEQAD